MKHFDENDHHEFLEGVRAAYAARDAELREKFDRSLAFGDAMFDRWERAEGLGFGQGTSVYNSAMIYGNVEIGSNTWVGPNTLLDGGSSGLKIGDWCAISSGVQIYTHHNVKRFLSAGRAPAFRAAVEIGNCCFIGGQTIIDPGVCIGDHCLVACNSFVNVDIPAFSIFGGTPARKIGEVSIQDEDVQLHFS